MECERGDRRTAWWRGPNVPYGAVLAALGIGGVGVGGGCQTTVTPPPARGGDAAVVYIADYGKHASLMMPVLDGTGVAVRPPRVREYAYSQWAWAAEGRNGWMFALPAMVVPGEGTLCVNEFPGPMNETRMRAHTEVEHLHPIRVSNADLVRLSSRLEEICKAERGRAVLESPTGWVYYPDENPYWVMHTCNAALVTWLKELGCEVDGQTVYADFEVKGR